MNAGFDRSLFIFEPNHAVQQLTSTRLSDHEINPEQLTTILNDVNNIKYKLEALIKDFKRQSDNKAKNGIEQDRQHPNW